MPLTSTALRLRHLRTERNLSQLDVANYLGISRTAYNKYENGFSQPSRTIKKLAELFCVSTDYILGTDTPGIEQQVMDISMEKQIKKYLALNEKSRYIVDTLVNKLYQDEQTNKSI